MKNILKILILLLLSIFSINLSFANSGCLSDGSKSISECMDQYKPDYQATLSVSGAYTIEAGFKEGVKRIALNISILTFIFAVIIFAYAGFLMMTSQGADDKLKKAKNIFKTTIFGLLGLVTAGGIIMLVVNLIYSVSK